MSQPKKILVVEDEPDIQELIEYNLEKQGYEVRVASDGEKALAIAASESADLILLDIMLPVLDGLTVCRKIRELDHHKATPIIMLTAKGEESDIVVGLELGADDYMTKPFSPKELIARIRAHIRRVTEAPKVVSALAKGSENSEGSDVLRVGAVTMDLSRHEVFLEDQKLQLTLAEFKLLNALAEKPGKVFTRDQLLTIIAGEETYLVDRNVDVHVRAIRKKLGDKSTMIETIRGVGYKCKD